MKLSKNDLTAIWHVAMTCMVILFLFWSIAMCIQETRSTRRRAAEFKKQKSAWEEYKRNNTVLPGKMAIDSFSTAKQEII